MPLHETPAGTVETLEWGEGREQIILLHAAASSPHALTGLAECLARQDRLVIAPMLNGYGRTQMRGTGDPLKAHLAVAAACLDLYPADRRIVFGHSMGGLVALLAALQHDPPDVLILYDPIVIGVLDPDDPADRAARDSDRAVIRDLAAEVAAGRPERGVATFVEAWNDVDWAAIPVAARTRLVESAPLLVAEATVVSEQEIDPDTLANFAAPVLLLHGTASPDLPRRAIGHLTRRLRHAKCTPLNGLDHMGPMTMPAAVAAAIETFLSQG